MKRNCSSIVLVFVLTGIMVSSTTFAQDANLKQAFAIKPKQDEVDYDMPSKDQLKECKFEKTTDRPGFVVYEESGRVLRQFYDNNRDGKLDQWSYFKNGMEVYRDIDANYDRKTDEYRWLGSGGTKWGLDPNQDGQIDTWRVISAEEVAYEVFQAIKYKDQRRFENVLMNQKEFESLKLEIGLPRISAAELSQQKRNFWTCANLKNRSAPKPSGFMPVMASPAWCPPAPTETSRISLSTIMRQRSSNQTTMASSH